MPGIELLIVATTPALQASLGRYAGLEVISVPTLDIALRLIDNERAPHVVYLEDTGGNVWNAVVGGTGCSRQGHSGVCRPAARRQARLRRFCFRRRRRDRAGGGEPTIWIRPRSRPGWRGT